MDETGNNKREYMRSYYAKNKERMNEQSRQWREKNRERHRELAMQWIRDNPERRRASVRRHKLKTKYGITLEDYTAMLAKQGGLCALCGSDDPSCVDHDHATGHIRGVLCGKCNKGLGLLGDTTECLERAVVYLRESSESPPIPMRSTDHAESLF